MKAFKCAHEAYHQQLKSFHELQESNEYRTSVETATQEFENEIDLWLTQISLNIKRSFAHQPNLENPTIEPDDSVSNVRSRVFSRASYRTRSSCNNSIRSTTSERAKAAARKAALEAEAEILKHLQQLEIEEIVLQQHKKQLQLHRAIRVRESWSWWTWPTVFFSNR